MKTFTVKEVAEMLNTNPETVRRWIRAGKLKSEKKSRKSGNVITDNDLKDFVNANPKYESLAHTISEIGAISAISAIGLGLAFPIPIIAGGVAGIAAITKIANSINRLNSEQEESIIKDVDSVKTLLSYLKKAKSDNLAKIDKLNQEINTLKQDTDTTEHYIHELESLLEQYNNRSK